MRPDLPALDLLEAGVVEQAEEGLEEEGYEDDDADDRVVVDGGEGQLIGVVSNTDAKSGSKWACEDRT